MCWYLALTAVENDEEVQRNGIVEVFFANGALGKQTKISDYLTQGFASLLSMPIRLVGIHFCYDNYLFQPILKLTQIVFGASNRLRFRAHHGTYDDTFTSYHPVAVDTHDPISIFVAITTRLLTRTSIHPSFIRSCASN